MKLTEEALRDAALADALLGIVQARFRPDDPERLWVEWVEDNLGDLKTAARHLLERHGEEVVVEEGPAYFVRLKAELMPLLINEAGRR